MNFFTTHISDKSNEYILNVLNSTFLSAGKMALKFENNLVEKLGLINPVSVNSGTSALHLALKTAGIGEQDEVILSPQTFIASGLSILMAGAKPVFVDIDYNTGNISPDSIEQSITEKTKAIMPIHWGGYPCDMDEIIDIANKYNLTVIEDAAHALGAKYKSKNIGTISDFTCFSFQAIKHITTGDGGAVCCKSDENYKIAKELRWFGIDRENSKSSILGEREFDLNQLGYKYHMNDFSASLGLANLEDIDYILNRRIQIANYYNEKLKNIPGIELFHYVNDRQSSYWLYTFHVEQRENFIRKLLEYNIPSSVVHLRIDKYSIFGGKKKLENMERFDKDQISIPVHQNLKDSEIEMIVEIIKKGW